jgi:hypothetical protein
MLISCCMFVIFLQLVLLRSCYVCYFYVDQTNVDMVLLHSCYMLNFCVGVLSSGGKEAGS